MAVDWDKPIQTRDGRQARLLGMRNHPKYPRVVAAPAYGGDGFENVDVYTEDGEVYAGGQPHACDIINAPQRHVRWLNVFRLQPDTLDGLMLCWYSSRELADKWGVEGGSHRIACIRVEFEEGEGL